MKIGLLESIYINEEEQQDILDEIEMFEKEIKEEKERLHHQELIEKLFFQLLNATPRKKDGVWVVGTTIVYDREIMTNQEINDINFFEDFLKEYDFNYEVQPGTSSYFYLVVRISLEERDQLEEFLKSQNDTKVLSKINIRRKYERI